MKIKCKVENVLSPSNCFVFGTFVYSKRNKTIKTIKYCVKWNHIPCKVTTLFKEGSPSDESIFLEAIDKLHVYN